MSDGLLDIGGVWRFSIFAAILSESSCLIASFLIWDAILLSIKIGGLTFGFGIFTLGTFYFDFFTLFVRFLEDFLDEMLEEAD